MLLLKDSEAFFTYVEGVFFVCGQKWRWAIRIVPRSPNRRIDPSCWKYTPVWQQKDPSETGNDPTEER